MPNYSPKDILRIAKRVNNAKRAYLLVNPLQAKHIPVSPSESLRMMNSLGSMLAEKYPGTKLVIGFAETATAIGAAVANRLAGDCVYLHTTREAVPEVERWILFSEEHSHAVEQKLCADKLDAWIDNTEHVIFVDDEISTGKTLMNMIRQLKERYPQLSDKGLVAASLLNRVSRENEQKLSDAGIHCEWLVKLTEDNAADAAAFRAEEASPVKAVEYLYSRQTLDCGSLPDPRKGVSIKFYLECCERSARSFTETLGTALDGAGNIVVLGTEECMYPALILGRGLEANGFSVRCHATTRSPIGICGAPGYPIVSGNRLQSFYEERRDTYIYNISRCDALIVVSDVPFLRPGALNELIAAWAPFGCRRIFFLQGGNYVWYIQEPGC